MTLMSDPNFEENLTFCLKSHMNNLVNFNSSSGKSENVHFDRIFLSKVCNIWAKRIQANCVVKNDLWFQKCHKDSLKVILDKSSVYNVLVEGMHFLDKCSPLNFNFSDFPLLVWSYPNSSYDSWNQE